MKHAIRYGDVYLHRLTPPPQKGRHWDTASDRAPQWGPLEGCLRCTTREAAEGIADLLPWWEWLFAYTVPIEGE